MSQPSVNITRRVLVSELPGLSDAEPSLYMTKTASLLAEALYAVLQIRGGSLQRVHLFEMRHDFQYPKMICT